MKKFIFLLSLMSILISCSDDYVPSNPAQEQSSRIRSIADAVKIAESLNNSGYSSRAPRSVEKNAVKVITRSSSRSSSDTLLYVVEYGEDAGFVVVSAPKSVEPVIAVIENGSYESAISNDEFRYVMELSEEFVFDGLSGDSAIRVLYADTTFVTEHTPNRVNVCWGQYWPENIYCPNSKAGCAPLAIAQMMSYLKPELNMVYTFPERDINSETINWDLLLTHRTSSYEMYPTEEDISLHNSDCNASETAHRQLARLVRQIGVECCSEYLFDHVGIENTTSTLEENAINALFYFFPEQQYDHAFGSNFTDLYNLLKEDGVATIFGYQFIYGSKLGHAWVADGTLCFGTRVTHYMLNDETGEYEELFHSDQWTSKYLHMNWGWSGRCNGYFLLGVFKPGRTFDWTDRTEELDFSHDTYYYYFK